MNYNTRNYKKLTTKQKIALMSAMVGLLAGLYGHTNSEKNNIDNQSKVKNFEILEPKENKIINEYFTVEIIPAIFDNGKGSYKTPVGYILYGNMGYKVLYNYTIQYAASIKIDEFGNKSYYAHNGGNLSGKSAFIELSQVLDYQTAMNYLIEHGYIKEESLNLSKSM